MNLNQEIDMFLGNNMATQMDPTTTRDDTDIAESKGFNNKSFRNRAPSAKKARRREKKKRRKQKE